MREQGIRELTNEATTPTSSKFREYLKYTHIM
jgi:hypothetical protein